MGRSTRSDSRVPGHAAEPRRGRHAGRRRHTKGGRSMKNARLWYVVVALSLISMAVWAAAPPAPPPPRFSIRVGCRIGYADLSGKIVINPQFDDAGEFSGGYAWIKMDRRYGYVDTAGRITVNPQFNNARDFNSGLACVELDRWGFVGSKGQFVINPQF